MQENREYERRVYKESVSKIEQLILKSGFKIKQVMFISDQKIWKKNQNFFDKNLIKKFYDILLLENPYASETFCNVIISKSKDAKLIIALGSGTINDLCKYSANILNIPYIIIPSASSMNGYLSQNASITINGHKKTILAKMPFLVYLDLLIIKKAPLRLNKSGIGDLMCFYSCWFDWYMTHKIFKGDFNKIPFQILEKKMQEFCKNYHNYDLKNEVFLELLMDILLLSGYGMTIAGGSYPASQSEHLIAHCLVMKYPRKISKMLHGEIIAISTISSLQFQQEILNLLEKNKLFFNQEKFNFEKVCQFFDQEIAYECNNEYVLKSFDETQIDKINRYIIKNSKKLHRELSKIFFSKEKIKKIFSHFKINYSVKSLRITENQYLDCIKYSKFIRNRLTCLDFFKND